MAEAFAETGLRLRKPPFGRRIAPRVAWPHPTAVPVLVGLAECLSLACQVQRFIAIHRSCEERWPAL